MTDLFVNAMSNSDERLVDQGQVYLWCLQPVSTTLSMVMEIEYDLLLFVPQLSAQESGAQYQVVDGNTADRINATSYQKPAGQAAPLLNLVNQAVNGAILGSAVQDNSGLLAAFGLRQDAAGNTYLDLAPGLWNLACSVLGVCSDASSGTPKWLPAIRFIISENNPTYIGESTQQKIDDLGSLPSSVPSAGIGTNYNVNVGIPPGGAKVYAGFDPTFATGLISTALYIAAVTFTIGSGVDSLTPGIYLGLRPGKYGRQKRAEHKALMLARSVPAIGVGGSGTSVPSTALSGAYRRV
jgi:hypothetical protein